MALPLSKSTATQRNPTQDLDLHFYVLEATLFLDAETEA